MEEDDIITDMLVQMADDAAALGDSSAIWRLAQMESPHSRRQGYLVQRAKAVDFRLHGEVERALRLEARADEAANNTTPVATRGGAAHGKDEQ